MTYFNPEDYGTVVRGLLADICSLLNRYVNDTSRETVEMFNSHRLYFHQPVGH
jgi:hypothetical protein